MKTSKMKRHSVGFIPAALSLFLAVFATQQLRGANALGNETDYMALLSIKSRLIDHHPEGVLSSWNHSLHHCFWEGVICGHKHKRVIELDLNVRDLAGTISPFIGNLSFLRSILLANNSLHGQIPHEIGHLFRLQVLNLQNNTLIGEIPTNISGCINLKNLSVAINNLQGKLPMGLGALSNLKSLRVNSNKLSGIIPASISNLSSLEKLFLYNNQLHGNLPMGLGELHSLKQLYVGINNFTGMIPQSIFNLSSLRVLDLSINQLQGSIPPDIALTLPQLQYLVLHNNYLSGPLPISIQNLTSLQFFELSSNYFTGSVPIHFGQLHNLQCLHLYNNKFAGNIDFISTLVNCSRLEYLDLERNHFSGSIPKVVANLSTSLLGLWVGGNPITGGIPKGISNLINLTFLYLDACKLTGIIPQDLGKLQKLERLYISSNRLKGELPYSFRNLSRLSWLYLDDNELHGRIPPSLSSCENLLYLSLSYNNFSGSLLNEMFGGSAKFIYLNMFQNQLEGPLPAEISKQINLLTFDVSKNKLSGKIPQGFGSLSSLQYLYMHHNFFQGSIPPSFASLKSLITIDLSQNNISGPLPEYFSAVPLIYLNLSYNNFKGKVPTKGVYANASAVSLVGNSGLCGGIPDFLLPKCAKKERKKRRISCTLKLKIIPIICAFVGVLAIATCIWLYLTGHSRKRKSVSSDTLVKEPFLKVSYDMLAKATNGFSSGNLLGSGTFGSVFKGIMDGKTIAIKVLNLQRRGGSKSFMAECEALRNIRHRNLVGIVTACSSTDCQRNDFKALVYEFMPNGSVERWLHENGNLSLLQRLDIAIDVAHALNYLHCECGNPIVHCDLKPSNILLDNDMVAHVADFGLAKVLGQPLHPNQSSSIGVRGTVGYVAPEYGVGSEVSLEADLYSYGILLLELMTRKRPTDNMFKEDFNLYMYAKAALPDQVLQIVDSTLMEDQSGEANEMGARTQTMLQKREECMVVVVKVGVACSSHLPHDRMKIGEAISELLKAKNIICNPRQRRNLPRGASD